MAWLMGRGRAWAGLLVALPAALAQDAPGALDGNVGGIALDLRM